MNRRAMSQSIREADTADHIERAIEALQDAHIHIKAVADATSVAIKDMRAELNAADSDLPITRQSLAAAITQRADLCEMRDGVYETMLRMEAVRWYDPDD